MSILKNKGKDFNQLQDESGFSENSFIDLMSYQQNQDMTDQQNSQQVQQPLTPSQILKNAKHRHKSMNVFQGNQNINYNQQVIQTPVHIPNKMSSDVAFLGLTHNDVIINEQDRLTQKDSAFKRGFKKISLQIKSKFGRNNNLEPLIENQDGSSSKYIQPYTPSKGQFSDSEQNEIQYSDDEIDESVDSEVERLRKQIPENIKLLLLQPKRELNLKEFNEQSSALDNERLAQLMQRKSEHPEENREDIDNNFLQQALQIEDTDFNQFLSKTVDLKMKSNIKMPCLIFSYKAKCRMYWDLLIIIFAIQNCIMIPIQVAFGDDFYSVEAIKGLDYFGYVVDFLFGMDILVSYRTSFLNVTNGKEVTDWLIIGKRYISSGNFFMDLASTIPFDDIISNLVDGETAKHLGLLGLIKMTRLLRLRKIITFMNVQQSFKVGFRMLQLIMLLLLVVHWVGCIWFFFVQQERNNGSPPWIPVIDQDKENNMEFYDFSAQYQYLVVFYYAVLILIGKANEMSPVTEAQTIYAAAILIIGLFILTFLFGNIAATLENATKKESKLSQILNYIQATMVLIKLPEQLQDEVIKYVMQAEQSPEVQQDMETFLETLSPAMKSSILNYIHSRVIGCLDEFKDAHDAEISYISANLKTFLVLPKDLVIQQGNYGNEMFFVISGKLEVTLVQSNSTQVNNLLKDPKEKDDSTKNTNVQNITFNETIELNQAINNDQQSSGQQSKAFNSLNNSMNGESQNFKRFIQKKQTILNILESGDYFGEISVLSSLKRTASVKATDYCTLSFITKDVMMSIKREYPQIYINFQKKLISYNDDEMSLRRAMIRNIPFLKHISDDLVTSLCFLLRETVYDYSSTVVQHGDLSDRIHIIWKGFLKVEIFFNGKDHLFEKLNRGGCFCVFSAFSDDYTQMFDFKVASQQASILSLKAQDLIQLSKSNLELADIIKNLEVSIKRHRKSDFDFFRFQPPSLNFQEPTTQYKKSLRLKFRKVLLKILKQLKNNTIQMTETLRVIQQICKQRKIREQQMKMLMINKDYNKLEIEKKAEIQKGNSNLQFSLSSKEFLTSEGNQSSSLSSLLMINQVNKKQEDSPKVHDFNIEKNLHRICEFEKKVKKQSLRDILNPLDVPGVELKIFERIDGIPKDQNLYTSSMIDTYENLKARIEKAKQTRENIQFLNRIIYKQNAQIHQLQSLFNKQIENFEKRIADLAMKLRHKQRIVDEENLVIQEEKHLDVYIEPAKIKHEVQTVHHKFESFAPINNNYNQINIENQINNYITVNEEGKILETVTEYINNPKSDIEVTEVLSRNDETDKDQDIQIQFEEECGEPSQVLEEDTKTIASEINEEQMEIQQKKKKKTKSKSQQDRTRRQYDSTTPKPRRFIDMLQSQINKFADKEANTQKSQDKKANSKIRKISALIDNIQPQSLESLEEYKEDFNISIKKLADTAVQHQRVVDTPQSYQKYIKTFKSKIQKIESIEYQQSGYSSSVKEEKSQNDDKFDKSSQGDTINSKQLFQHSSGNIGNNRLQQRAQSALTNHRRQFNNTQNIQSQVSQKQIGNNLINNQGENLQMISLPERPQTRDQSRVGLKNIPQPKIENDISVGGGEFYILDNESEMQSIFTSNLQSKARLTSQNSRLPQQMQNSNTRNINFYNQQSSDRHSGLGNYQSGQTINRFNNKKNKLDIAFDSNLISQQQNSEHGQFKINNQQQTIQTLSPQNPHSQSSITPMNRQQQLLQKDQMSIKTDSTNKFTSTAPVTRQQTKKSQQSKSKNRKAHNLEISEQDKERWLLYRNMISQTNQKPE